VARRSTLALDSRIEDAPFASSRSSKAKRIQSRIDNMERAFTLFAWIAIAVSPSCADVASIRDIPMEDRRQTQCMMKVLQKTPHVNQIELGIADLGHPFVQYHYQEGDGRDGSVRFVKDMPGTSKGIDYTALLNGMTDPRLPPLDLGTTEITKRWRFQCGVDALALLE
jgi:hypothetical protein